MSDLSRTDILKELSENELLSAEDLNSLTKEEKADEDSEAFLKRLVQEKKLTPFQAKHVWKGKAKALVMGNYVVLDKLGQGGMGMVFKAQHKLMKRVVALKVLSHTVIKHEQMVQRFLREVEVAAKLSHPNIVAAHDADQFSGSYFLIMEYVDGRDLSEIVIDQGPATVEQSTDFILQAARGLEYAHANGVVHRDIKPANLLLDTSGTVKILDMGLARLDTPEEADEATAAGLTSTGTIMGTVDFMAPEQAEDTKSAGPRADIYSLGASLHFLLVCRPPLIAGTIGQKLKGLMTGSGVPRSIREQRADVPETLDAVYRKMTELDPANRYQSATEVIADLEAIRAGTSPMTAMGGIHPVAARSESSAMNSFLESLEPGSQPAPETFVDSPEVGRYREEFPRTSGPSRRDEPGEPSALKNHTTERRDFRRLIPAGGALVVFLMGLIVWSFNSPNSDETSSNVAESASTKNSAKATPIDEDEKTRRVKNSDEWIDLLSDLEPEMHAVAGEWRLISDGLTTNAVTSARLRFPYEVPSEYDVRMTFTRRTGRDSIAIIFPHGDGQATYELDAWGLNLAGIQDIDGVHLSENSTRRENQALQNGRRYTAELRVRSNRVEAYLDGELLASVETDGSDLSPLPGWQIQDSDALGIGAFNAETTFHTVEVRPVNSSDSR